MFLELHSTESQARVLHVESSYRCSHVWLVEVLAVFPLGVLLSVVSSEDTLLPVGTLERRQVVCGIWLQAAAASCAQGSYSGGREPVAWVPVQVSRTRHFLFSNERMLLLAAVKGLSDFGVLAANPSLTRGLSPAARPRRRLALRAVQLDEAGRQGSVPERDLDDGSSRVGADEDGPSQEGSVLRRGKDGRKRLSE